jgi:hypothetical protein
MSLPIQRGAISSLAPLSYLTPAIIFGFMYSFSAKLIAWAICGGVGVFWAQTPRCFLFGMRGLPENADWRDTAFVACSNPGLIQEVLDELTKPLSDRRHISGPIAAGDGGHNFNGPHRFAWHFVPDQWSLAEISIELCDGRPTTMWNKTCSIGSIKWGASARGLQHPCEKYPHPMRWQPLPQNSLSILRETIYA